MDRKMMFYARHGSNRNDRCPRCRSMACGLGKICSACGVNKAEFIKIKNKKGKTV